MNATFLLSGAVLLASLFFGGGARRDILSDWIPVLLSCALLVVAYPSARHRLAEDRFFAALLIALLVVVLLQFIPLPPVIWGGLPGRTELTELFMQSGVAPPWSSLAVRSAEAARSAISLLPGLALCLATINLDSDQRQNLVYIVIAAALINAPLGMLQILGGPGSPLYFYRITNQGNAVGLFANRNHFAALFFCTIPFVVATFTSKKQIAGAPRWMLGAVAGFILVIGLSISGSRTALILGIVAVVLSVLFVARRELNELIRGRRALAALGVSALLIIPLAMGAGLLAIFQRFDTQDLVEDGRWTFAKITWDAIVSFLPVGAGLGSFQQLYQLREPAETVVQPIVNHAHNDWLEVTLELGLPGVLLAASSVVWMSLALKRAVGMPGTDGRVARAALIALLLLAIHSIWDYPLRTVALSALFGLCCGLTFRPGVAVAREEPGRKRRRRSNSSSRRSANATA